MRRLSLSLALAATLVLNIWIMLAQSTALAQEAEVADEQTASEIPGTTLLTLLKEGDSAQFTHLLI